MENKIEKGEIKRGKHYPLIGNFINYHIAQNHIKKTEVAKALGTAPNGLTAYLKRETLQFDILWKLSLTMKHNFLAQLGEYLPYRFETQREKALLKELAEKDVLIKKMEIQMEVYERMLGK